jgi:hypothetical protein
LPSRTTPPIFPLRTRERNLRLGGAVSVPITVSAVSEKPVASPVLVASCKFVGCGLAAAEAAEAAATATRPASVLIIANKVALTLAAQTAANCREAARD